MAKQVYKNSLLYKISGGQLRQPSYLFGTMHMICANDFYIPNKVLSALGKCSVYYMEMDLGSETENETIQQASAENQDWTEIMTDKERNEIEQIGLQQLGIPPEKIGEIQPLALINQMTVEAMGCDDIKVAEIELLKIAQEAGLQTAGLETAEQQIKMAEKVFTGKELINQLKMEKGDYKILFQKMTSAYQNEKINELAKLVTDRQFMSRRAFNILVINRNKRWIKKIVSLISKQRCFFAVGAGHLPGETGLLSALTNKGFKVNPVYR